MDRYKTELGIRAIRELEKQRNRLCDDVEISIIKIKICNKEITEIIEILNEELLAKE